MELFLFALTLVAVIVAGLSSFIAWRLTRAEHARSEARVAALAEAIEAPGSGVEESPRPLHRVGSFRPDGHRPVEAAAARREPPASWETTPENAWQAPAAEPHGAEPRVVGLFGSEEAAEPRRWQVGPVAALVGVLALAFIGSLVMVTGGTPGAAATANATASAPLELLSLRHAQREGAMEITGLVRNPAAAAPTDRVTAVVFFFDATGGFLSSARAPLDFTRLSPGEESPFVVLAQPPAGVSRYRVSFRRDDGVVPHVDRREKSR
jgi:hypothetical protein